MSKGHPEFELAKFENGSEYRFAIILTRWNKEINDEMLAGAKQAFADYGIPLDNLDVFYAPGAFELPVLAQELADTDNYNAILAFATVIRGQTSHYDLVLNEANRGLMQVSLDHGVPVMNGLLGVDKIEHAQERAYREKGNKGYEIALSAMDISKTISKLD